MRAAWECGLVPRQALKRQGTPPPFPPAALSPEKKVHQPAACFPTCPAPSPPHPFLRGALIARPTCAPEARLPPTRALMRALAQVIESGTQKQVLQTYTAMVAALRPAMVEASLPATLLLHEQHLHTRTSSNHVLGTPMGSVRSPPMASPMVSLQVRAKPVRGLRACVACALPRRWEGTEGVLCAAATECVLH